MQHCGTRQLIKQKRVHLQVFIPHKISAQQNKNSDAIAYLLFFAKCTISLGVQPLRYIYISLMYCSAALFMEIYGFKTFSSEKKKSYNSSKDDANIVDLIDFL